MQFTKFVDEARNEVPCVTVSCKFYDEKHDFNCARGDSDDNAIPCEYCVDYIPITLLINQTNSRSKKHEKYKKTSPKT